MELYSMKAQSLDFSDLCMKMRINLYILMMEMCIYLTSIF